MARPKSRAELERDIEDALADSGGQVGYWPAIPSTTRDVPAWRRPAEAARAKAKAKAKTKAKAAKATPISVVLGAVRSAPANARYGQSEVFVYPLWKKVGKRLGMSLEQFKRWLVDQNRAQNLTLVRADMVDDMDPDLVEKSEIADLGAQFHFVIDTDARRRWP